MAEIKSFTLYYDALHLITTMNDSQAGRLLKSLFNFSMTGEIEDMSDDGMIKMAFNFIANKIQQDTEKYKAKCAKNKEIALERERKRRERNLALKNLETSEVPTPVNVTEPVNATAPVNVTEPVNTTAPVNAKMENKSYFVTDIFLMPVCTNVYTYLPPETYRSEFTGLVCLYENAHRLLLRYYSHPEEFPVTIEMHLKACHEKYLEMYDHRVVPKKKYKTEPKQQAEDEEPHMKSLGSAIANLKDNIIPSYERNQSSTGYNNYTRTSRYENDNHGYDSHERDRSSTGYNNYTQTGRYEDDNYGYDNHGYDGYERDRSSTGYNNYTRTGRYEDDNHGYDNYGYDSYEHNQSSTGYNNYTRTGRYEDDLYGDYISANTYERDRRRAYEYDMAEEERCREAERRAEERRIDDFQRELENSDIPLPWEDDIPQYESMP